MKPELKKLLVLNLPYLLFVYLFAKCGQTYRLSAGADASAKLLHLTSGISAAFASPLPSLHPFDLCVGVVGAVAVRLIVYSKGKNAKKYRKGEEYGSARWGTAKDIAPYIDPKFENNILLTQTERLTMTGRPKDPKTARNKNVLVIGGSGSGKTRFYVKPNLMQCFPTSDYPTSFVVTDPKGTLVLETGQMFQRAGYRVKILNTINFSKSMKYNPFVYIHSEKDVLKLVNTLILNGKDSVERMKEITDRLETRIQQLFDSDRYKAYLTTMAKFHNYSFNNTLLIAMQGGQLVAGFNKWKDTFHRTVKKGEKGIKILAPAPYKVKQKMEKLDEQGKPILDKDGKPLTEEKTVQIPAFKVVSVFDVSQTEGEPLPSIAVDELSGCVQDYQDFFKALEQTSPVPIGFEDIEGGAHGYFHLLDNRIAIQEGMSQLQTIKTAIHEIAHAKLHTIDPNTPEQSNRPDSRTREVQAESVAYAVCQHYGLDTSEYSFGYVAGWSSGRELAELKASLEIIRSAAHELISALDEHLAELRQQREADLSAAHEAAFALDNGNTLFIQTCDSGYDYTLYDADKKALDGGQLDAPGLTLPDAGQEALNLLGQTAAVSEVMLGDKLAAFQEAAEKANEIPEPVKIPDPAAEPTVTILWSESDKLQDGETMPLSVANRVFEELDTTQHTEREKDGYTGGWYDKTAFRIDFTLNGQPDNYEGRQDFGDGDGSLIQHIQSYHEYYAKDENWKNFVLHNKGPEAWEQDKAEREMVLTEFIPYLKQHCNLSAMEQTATAALREGQNSSPEQAAYYNAVVAYVQDCRPLLNQGRYNLPEPPKLADFDQSLQNYKAQVQAEIAQEAATAGMTVEEYAAAGFEAPQQDSFSIYQLRNEDSTRDYRFEPYDRLQAAGLTVDKANYTEVYAAPLTAGTTLEDIYRTFNVDHPADFKGHSLSVSDVVVLHQNGQNTAHYCDSVGFQQVPEFLRENPLRTAELSTEQNENMIDGVLNNAPSLGELEAKAKAGEQISLTDLAAAVKAEGKAPKAKKSHTAKPKKPSIRAQLDAAKKEQSKQTPPRKKTKELEV